VLCKHFHSKDCVHWGVLPPATPETKQKSKQITGYFTGDPSFEFEQKLIKKVGDGDEETEEVVSSASSIWRVAGSNPTLTAT